MPVPVCGNNFWPSKEYWNCSLSVNGKKLLNYQTLFLKQEARPGSVY